MKNNSSIRLMTLLKLLSDDFQPDEQRRIEGIVRADSEALARFQQMRDAVSGSSEMQFDSALVASTDRGDALERMAGFFDGTLSDAETVAFENECWESRELLHDVIVLFQSGLHSHRLPSPHPASFETLEQQRRMRERLIDLFPGEPSIVRGINGAETPLSAVADQSSRSHDLSREASGERLVVAQPRRSPKKTGAKTNLSYPAKIAIVISVTAALVALCIMIADSFWRHSLPAIVVESPIETEGQFNPLPEVASPRDTDLNEGDPDSIQPEQIVDLKNPLDRPRNVDQELPERMDPGTRDAPAPDGLVDRADPNTIISPKTVDQAVDTPAVQLAKLDWSWDRIEGLVAVRVAGSNVWSGALADSDLKSDPGNDSENQRSEVGGGRGLECKVLPLSWAQGSVKGLGSWTITENTDLFVSPLPVGDLDRQSAYVPGISSGSSNSLGVRIQLRSGRIAITNANVGSAVLIETATGNWRIRIADPDSVFIVEQESNSRVIVQKGSVMVNETLLEARQQLFRARNGRLEQATNRETIKWLKKPEYKFPSKQLSAQWLASGDLFSELSFSHVVSPEDQSFVRAAFATIDPPGQAAKYLSNVLPEVRAEGINWLLVYGRDPQRLRKLASELATEMNAPGLATTLPKLVIAIHRKRLPSKADVEFLISGLQNRNVSVRRLSHGFLVHLFGSIEDYDSESDAATRTLQSRKWLAAINRLYRRLENARRK